MTAARSFIGAAETRRLLRAAGLCLLLFLSLLSQPASADDISATARSVVRVIAVAFGSDGEISGVGFGSGFAVAPDRIVTNLHVVTGDDEADTVEIAVVPSEGSRGHRAEIAASAP